MSSSHQLEQQTEVQLKGRNSGAVCHCCKCSSHKSQDIWCLQITFFVGGCRENQSVANKRAAEDQRGAVTKPKLRQLLLHIVEAPGDLHRLDFYSLFSHSILFWPNVHIKHRYIKLNIKLASGLYQDSNQV